MRLRVGVCAILVLRLLNCTVASALSRRSTLRHLPPSLSYDDSLMNLREESVVSVAGLNRRVSYDVAAMHDRLNVALVLGAGWIVRYNRLDWAFSNVIPPSNELIRFYAEVLSLAGAVWAQEPAQNFRQASLGGITLTLWSTGPITWNFLNWFLISAVCPPNYSLAFLSHSEG